jgi:hypothetical protein
MEMASMPCPPGLGLSHLEHIAIATAKHSTLENEQGDNIPAVGTNWNKGRSQQLCQKVFRAFKFIFD